MLVSDHGDKQTRKQAKSFGGEALVIALPTAKIFMRMSYSYFVGSIGGKMEGKSGVLFLFFSLLYFFCLYK